MSIAQARLAPSFSNPDPLARTVAARHGIKFAPSEGFIADLKHRVDEYFRSTGRSPRDCPTMYVKTSVILAAAAAIYVLLVFVVSTWWLAVPLAALMGLAVVAIGFNIQHDAGHHAYSRHAWVNKLMAFSLDLIGGSSYLWDRKHNAMHHTYTNIAEEDSDIELGFLGRLAPQQRRLWFHRLQCFYIWPLYGFMIMKWHLLDDFKDVAVGRIGCRRVARPRGRQLVAFIVGKVVFFSLAFGLPLLLHAFWSVVLVYAIASFVCGITLSIVFQLAHCVEATQFPVPDPTGKMSTDWAVHQVHTTADFARGNPVLSCLLGGLNFQVEHHLLTHICHVHYPAISKLVEQTCADHGLPYNAYRGFFSAVASHFRWLRRMGQPVAQ